MTIADRIFLCGCIFLCTSFSGAQGCSFPVHLWSLWGGKKSSIHFELGLGVKSVTSPGQAETSGSNKGETFHFCFIGTRL